MLDFEYRRKKVRDIMLAMLAASRPLGRPYSRHSMFLFYFTSSLHIELSVPTCVRASVRNFSCHPYYRVVCLCAFVNFTNSKKESTENSNLALTRIKVFWHIL